MKLDKLKTPIKYGALVLVTAITLVGGYVRWSIPAVGEASAVANVPIASVPVSTPPVQNSSLILPNFANIVAEQGAAVVNISVSATAKTQFPGFPGFPQMDPNDPFYEFFRRFQFPAPPESQPTHGLGSGFIVSADGIILTNAHVVANADEVIVKLLDKREFKAKVSGIDKLSDVAVLKIDAKNLPTVKIGDPQNVRVGDWVIAIGSPFGFENTVTAGIISAKSRTLSDEGYVPFLQTDVAVNPGNSGGPLFNMNGEVIGINSQIYSRNGGYQGLSFAIPIDVAMNVERQLLDHGKVSRGRMGVTIQEMNQQLADSFGLDNANGALVSSVEKDSAADKAGIEPGDVILKFNGKDISRSNELPPLVSAVAPGTKAKVELWRKGKTREITVKVGELTVAGEAARSTGTDEDKLGLAVRPLTPEERRQTDGEVGLLVENVSDGPAARAGIRRGDVILSVNGEKTSSAEELRTLVAQNKKRIALLILRGKLTMFIPVNLG